MVAVAAAAFVATHMVLSKDFHKSYHKNHCAKHYLLCSPILWLSISNSLIPKYSIARLASHKHKNIPQCWHSFGKMYDLRVKFSEKLAKMEKLYFTSLLCFWCEWNFMTMAQENGLHSEFLIVKMLECSMGQKQRSIYKANQEFLHIII